MLGSAALLAPAVPGARTAEAQSAAERAALEALRDTLDSATAPSALDAVSLEWAPGLDPAMHRLRRGFISLAIGRLSGKRSDLDDALLQFDWATSRRKSWPYPWFGRGLTKLALSEGGFIPKEMAGQALGMNFYQGSIADLARSFEADSMFEAGVEYLTRILPAQGDRTQPVAYVRALAIAARDANADPRVRLVLARAYRSNGLNDRSLAELDDYLRAGGDTGIALLERARSLAGVGRLADAAEAWLAGASYGSENTRRIYRRDLAWIATERELAEWDSLPDGALREWVEHFWGLREAEAMRAPGERLREHLRRWAYAHRHFRIIAPERKTDFKRVVVIDLGPCTRSGEKSLDDLTFEDPARLDDLRRKERMLDHRGVIYIRHGEPARRLRTLPAQPGTLDPARMPTQAADRSPVPGPLFAELSPYVPQGLADGQSYVSSMSSEIWQYWFGGESRLLYFAGSTTLGTFAPTTLYSQLPLQPGLLYAAAQLDSRYRRIAFARENELAGVPRAIPVQCMPTAQALQKETRTAMKSAVELDSHTLLFPAPLDPVVQIAAVGAPRDGTSRMLVVFAVPGAGLVPEPRAEGDAGVRYRLGVRISAVDRGTGIFRRIDTVRTFALPDTLRGRTHLAGLMELPVPAGRYDVRVALFRPELSRGSVVMRPAVQVGGQGALTLSDIILGTESGGIEWNNRGDAVRLNALDAYTAGGAAPLYYEMHGLVPGRTYRTTVSLTRSGQRPDRGTRLLFSETAEAASVQVRRTMGLDDLRRGQYRLVVTVEEEGTGATVTRERMVNVVSGR
jgi:GWxTD domain-containing protein